MRRRRKMVRGIVMMVVIAAMFSMTALAATRWQASFTANSQTKVSPAVTKNNYNNEAEAYSASGVDSSICALQHGGSIALVSHIKDSGGNSGRMLFTSLGQTKYGTYGSYSYNSPYVLDAKLTGCSFTATYMRQNFDWTP